jgi:hypothetical protein
VSCVHSYGRLTITQLDTHTQLHTTHTHNQSHSLSTRTPRAELLGCGIFPHVARPPVALAAERAWFGGERCRIG